MLLKSSANTPSSPAENIPVSLFCLGEKRKFIRVSEDYEDTIRTLSRAFGIKEHVGRVSLQTSALDVCKGREIVIDESAYPVMWSFLEEMSVVVDHESEERVPSEGTSSRKSEKAPELPRNPLPTPTPEAPAAARSSASDDLYDFTSDNQRDMDEDRAMEEQHWEEEEVPIEGESIEGESIEGEPLEEPLTARVDNLYDFHEEQPTTLPRKKFKNVGNEGASSSSATTASDLFPRIKQEKVAPPTYDETPGPSRREKSPKKDNQNIPPADDPRFEITIIGPNNSCAQFKTRGKHQVRKVLIAACKTFEMDYNRAQLFLGIPVDGEEEMHESLCPSEETMSGCGVSPNSKMFIRETRYQDSD